MQHAATVTGDDLDRALLRAGAPESAGLAFFTRRDNWAALTVTLCDWHGDDWRSKLPRDKHLLWFKRAFVGAMLGNTF